MILFFPLQMGLSTFQDSSTPINNAAILSVSCTIGLNSQLSLKKDFSLKSFKKNVLLMREQEAG